MGDQPTLTIPQLAVAPQLHPIEIKRSDLPNLAAIKESLATRTPYWCGAMPGGPYQNYTFGGREFVLHQEDVQHDENGQTQRFRRAGKVHWLSDAQRDAVIADVKRKVMRGRGTGSKIQDTQDADYKPHDADHASGEYVFMVRVYADFQAPGYVKGTVPKGAVPLVPRLPEAVSA